MLKRKGAEQAVVRLQAALNVAKTPEEKRRLQQHLDNFTLVVNLRKAGFARQQKQTRD